MQQLYKDLLKEWCDALVRLQIDNTGFTGLDGGILCPVCSRVHGRAGEAVYPLMYMAKVTRDKKYLEAAVKLQKWSEHLSCYDGSYLNETEWSWKGITVFASISLGEAIRHHGDLLSNTLLEKWKGRLRAAAEFIYNNVNISYGIINYPAATTAAMAVAWKVFNDDRYLQRSRQLAGEIMNYFTENKLIFGEGSPQTKISSKGCRAVDLGYNVEESLPSLLMYSILAEDDRILNLVSESMEVHLKFMLPDGGWDNSWGTRAYKWTYWGSRTSDGCQSAYGLLGNTNPVFAEAAYRNVKLLKACTDKGVLFGGPHLAEKGEQPCIHHTICHAKALATVLDYYNPSEEPKGRVPIPREEARGLEYFKEIDTYLFSNEYWKATITGYDWQYHKSAHGSGGALTMLWNESIGPVVCGSMNKYWMVEGTNHQRLRDKVDIPLTPGLLMERGNERFSSTSDFSAVLQSMEENGCYIVKSSGKLVSDDQHNPPEGTIPYTLIYSFRKDALVIEISVNSMSPVMGIRYSLPIISSKSDEVVLENSGITIDRGENKIQIAASQKAYIMDCEDGRIFNHVPGFMAVPVYFEIKNDLVLRIEIRVIQGM